MFRTRQPTWWSLVATMLVLACTSVTYAQDAPEQQAAERPQLDLSHIPADAFVASVGFPRSVLSRPEMELLPLEILTAVGEQEFGIDPLHIEQVATVGSMPALGQPPQVGFVLHMSQPYAVEAVAAKLAPGAAAQTQNGRTIYAMNQRFGLALHAPDERTLLIAQPDLLGAMADAEESDKLLHSRLKQMDPGADLLVVASIETLRPLLQQGLAQAPIPPQFVELTRLVDLTSTVEIAMSDLQPSFGVLPGKVQINFHGNDAQAAVEIERLLNQGLELARTMLETQILQQMQNPNSDEVQQAMFLYSQRVMGALFKALKPERDERDVKIAVEPGVNAATTGVLVAALLPAVGEARDAARRMESMNKLKQIVLAMVNHESREGHFPTQAIFDEEGKPLLSWRVHVLPFIEEQALYEQFKLDEPWDSEHNRKLIAQMPEIFKSPGAVNLEEGKTVYQVPTGEGTIFEGTEGTTVSEIRDGASNTILVLEVDPEEAVIWTKPDDYEVDFDNPTRGLGGIWQGQFLTVRAQGSGHAVPTTMAADTLKAMFTKAGGER